MENLFYGYRVRLLPFLRSASKVLPEIKEFVEHYEATGRLTIGFRGYLLRILQGIIKIPYSRNDHHVVVGAPVGISRKDRSLVHPKFKFTVAWLSSHPIFDWVHKYRKPKIYYL